MAGDNFSVQVHSEGRKHFEAALRMAFDVHAKATHYLRGGVPKRTCDKCYGSGSQSFWEGELKKTEVKVTCRNCKAGMLPPREGIVLYWHEDKREGFDIQPLPFPMNADAAVEFLWAFLQSCEYGSQPDHDGSNGKGYEVTSGNFWGHVHGSHYSILAVYPEWQMYGK